MVDSARRYGSELDLDTDEPSTGFQGHITFAQGIRRLFVKEGQHALQAETNGNLSHDSISHLEHTCEDPRNKDCLRIAIEICRPGQCNDIRHLTGSGGSAGELAACKHKPPGAAPAKVQKRRKLHGLRRNSGLIPFCMYFLPRR